MMRVLFLATFLFTSFLLSAQDMIFPKFRIGWTPSAIVNAFPALQISLDKRISESVNFSLESAFIFTSVQNGKGFRIRPGIETFVTRSQWVSLVTGLHLNYRTAIDYNNDTRLASNGEFQFIDYNIKTVETLAGINIENKLMFKITERLFFDLGGGLGLAANRSVRSGTTFILNGEVVNDLDEEIVRVNPGLIFYTHFNISISL